MTIQALRTGSVVAAVLILIGSGSLMAQGLPVIDDVDTRLPRAKAANPNAIAVVIGNRNYEQKDVPRVEYAIRDAEAVRLYLINTLGYSSENIIFLRDAGKAVFEGVFGNATDARGRLADYIKPGQSDVFIFYSGHGAPDPATEKSYFVPADGDPNYIRLGGYPVDQLYANLRKLDFRSLTVVLDACFSGFTDQGTLVREASPALLKVKGASFDIPNASLFAASAQNQISSWYSDRQHGLFTYFFLKGLQGRAAPGKGSVTARELHSYVESQVTSMARRIKGRDQVPQFAGDSNRVIAAYGKDTLTVSPPAKVDLAMGNLQPQGGLREVEGAVPAAASPPEAASGASPASRLPFAEIHVKREVGSYTLDLRGCVGSSIGVLCHLDVTTASPQSILEISIQANDENGIPAIADCYSIGAGAGCDHPPARRDMVFRSGYSKFLVRFPAVPPSATQLTLDLGVKANTGWRGAQWTRVSFDPVPIVR